MAVDIFGCPADFDALMAIAASTTWWSSRTPRRRRARARGRDAGTLGHIGVFSLNYHKTIHCGEGGVAVTDDDRLPSGSRWRATTGRRWSPTWAPPPADVLGFNYRLASSRRRSRRCSSRG